MPDAMPKNGNLPALISRHTILSLCALLVLACIATHPITASAQTALSQVILDPNFRTPAPPIHHFLPNMEHVWAGEVGMTVIALIMVVISLIEGIKFNSTVPFALVMAAAFCVVPESIDNYLAGCYWSTANDPGQQLYFLMGRQFDYYVIPMWWAFGAVLGYALYAALLRNVKNGTLWGVFLLSGIADILFEETLLRYGGIYTYFGHQPLVLLGYFPWWWLAVNVAALFLTVALAYRFRDWFNGWKSALLCFLMPAGYIGGFAFAAMPVIFVIQGDFSPAVTQLGGILSVLIAMIETCGVMTLILGRNPFKLAEKADGPSQQQVTGQTTNRSSANQILGAI